MRILRWGGLIDMFINFKAEPWNNCQKIMLWVFIEPPDEKQILIFICEFSLVSYLLHQAVFLDIYSLKMYCVINL